jgi:hypothetical protein
MGHLLKIICVDSRVNMHISKSVAFTLTTGQVPNLALTHMKRITVNLAIPYSSKTTSPRFFYNKRLRVHNCPFLVDLSASIINFHYINPLNYSR